jgi:hypothetical protein
MTDDKKIGVYIVTEDKEFEDEDGKFSITLRHIDDNSEGFILTGLLRTRVFITKLIELRSVRYSIWDIEIIASDMGSHSDEIIYNFKAKGFEWRY